MKRISKRNSEEAKLGVNTNAREPCTGYKKCRASPPPLPPPPLPPPSTLLLLSFMCCAHSVERRSSSTVLEKSSFLVAGRRGRAVMGTRMEYSPVESRSTIAWGMPRQRAWTALGGLGMYTRPLCSTYVEISIWSSRPVSKRKSVEGVKIKVTRNRLKEKNGVQ